MPQKRNPYALVVIRGAAGTLLGRADRAAGHPAHAVRRARTTCSTPTASSAARSTWPRARSRSRRRRRRASSSTATPRARAVRESFALAADVAEAISLTTGLDYRAPTASSAAPSPSTRPLDARAALDAAARELLGRRLELDAAALADALDPAARDRHPHRARRRRAGADGRDAARLPRRRSSAPARGCDGPAGGDRAPPSARCSRSATPRGSRSSVSKRRPRRSVSSAITSSGAMLPRLTFGPIWRSSHACCARRGASKITVSRPTAREDRVDQLAVHVAVVVEQPDRAALAALGDDQRGAGGEVGQHLGAPVVGDRIGAALAPDLRDDGELGGELARSAPPCARRPAAATRWRPRCGRCRARAATPRTRRAAPGARRSPAACRPGRSRRRRRGRSRPCRSRPRSRTRSPTPA